MWHSKNGAKCLIVVGRRWAIERWPQGQLPLSAMAARATSTGGATKRAVGWLGGDGYLAAVGFRLCHSCTAGGGGA